MRRVFTVASGMINRDKAIDLARRYGGLLVDVGWCLDVNENNRGCVYRSRVYRDCPTRLELP